MINIYKADNLPKDIKVDLHMHTSASDGTWTPSELIKKIIEAEIGLFAVTDHDTVRNVKETEVLAKENGIAFVPGIEINTQHKGKNIHILGHGIDIENKNLLNLVSKNTDYMNEKDDQSIKALSKIYNEINFDEYKAYKNDSSRGGWKALNYALDKGICENYIQFFVILENLDEKIFRFMDFVSPKEAINAILDAGGVPVLAHPGVGFYGGDYKSIIEDMINEGIKGIECFHPDNSKEVTEYSLQICENRGLFSTAGSDCHGVFLKHRSVGVPDVRLSKLKLI